MNPKKSTLILSSAAIIIACASMPSAHAAVIVSETFGGTSADLQGKTATSFATGITTAGGSNVWQANTAFNRDGTTVGFGTGNTGGSAYLNLGTYIDAAKGTATGKFTLTATLNVTSGSWLALGFAGETAPSIGRNFTNNPSIGGTTTGYANMLVRGNGTAGDIDAFAGSAATNQRNADDTVFSTTATLIITLDFTTAGGYNGTTNFGTASFQASYGAGPTVFNYDPFTYTTNAPIGSLLLSWAGSDALGDGTGSYSNISLSQIPEPSAALLGAFGFLALLRRRRN